MPKEENNIEKEAAGKEKDKKKRRKILLLIIPVFLLCLITFLIIMFRMERITATVMRLQRMVGKVDLFDADGTAQSLTESLRLKAGNRLDTGDQSLAGISLDDTKIITIEENSEVEFSSTGSKLEIILKKGRIFFNVTEHLDENKTFDIKTSTMVVGIRGTSGVVETDNMGHPSVMITDGVTEVTGTNPKTGETVTTEVKASEMATLFLDEEAAGNATASFSSRKIKEEDLLAFALDAIKKDPSLMDRIAEATGFDKNRLSVLADIMTSPGKSMYGKAAEDFKAAGKSDAIPFLGSDADFMRDAAQKAREASGGNLEIEAAMLRGSRQILEKDDDYVLPGDAVDTLSIVTPRLAAAGFNDSEIETIIDTVVFLYEENYRGEDKNEKLVANDHPTGEFVEKTINDELEKGSDPETVVKELLREKKEKEKEEEGGKTEEKTPTVSPSENKIPEKKEEKKAETKPVKPAVPDIKPPVIPVVNPPVVPPPTDPNAGGDSGGSNDDEEKKSEEQPTPTPTPKLPKYTIKFLDYDGTELLTMKVEKGSVPNYGSNPTRAEDDNYTYTFSGWSDGTKTYAAGSALPKATADTTYTAQYTQTAKEKKYSITTDTGGVGSITVQAEAKAGETVSFSVNVPTGYTLDSAPTIEGVTVNTVGNNTYSFTMPSKDVTIRAIFTAVAYQVKLVSQLDGDTVWLSQETANVNQTITVTFEENYYKQSEGLLSVRVISGNENVAVSHIEHDNVYSFIMPASDVEVYVSSGQT